VDAGRADVKSGREDHEQVFFGCGFEAFAFFGAFKFEDFFGEKKQAENNAGVAFRNRGGAFVMAGDGLDDVRLESEGGSEFAGGLGVVEFVAVVFQARDVGIEVHRAFQEVKVIGQGAFHGRHEGVMEKAGCENVFDKFRGELVGDGLGHAGDPFKVRPDFETGAEFADAVGDEGGHGDLVKPFGAELGVGGVGRIDGDAGIKPAAVCEFKEALEEFGIGFDDRKEIGELGMFGAELFVEGAEWGEFLQETGAVEEVARGIIRQGLNRCQGWFYNGGFGRHDVSSGYRRVGECAEVPG
jgi:hypothetical protein